MAEHTHDAARLKPVLLGEMPSERGDEFYMFPLSGQPAVKLLKWAGIKKEEGAAYWTLIEHFHPINAQERHGPKFDLPAASKRWTEYLLRECGEGREPVTVVCLGRNAQRTIGAQSRCTCGFHVLEGVARGRHSVECPAYLGDWFYWREAGLLRYVPVPHPSGRNRLWNEPDAEEKMALVLKEALLLAKQESPAGLPARYVVEDGRVHGGPVR